MGASSCDRDDFRRRETRPLLQIAARMAKAENRVGRRGADQRYLALPVSSENAKTPQCLHLSARKTAESIPNLLLIHELRPIRAPKKTPETSWPLRLFIGRCSQRVCP